MFFDNTHFQKTEISKNDNMANMKSIKITINLIFVVLLTSCEIPQPKKFPV